MRVEWGGIVGGVLRELSGNCGSARMFGDCWEVAKEGASFSTLQLNVASVFSSDKKHKSWECDSM